jgi:hypothetical protein
LSEEISSVCRGALEQKTENILLYAEDNPFGFVLFIGVCTVSSFYCCTLMMFKLFLIKLFVCTAVGQSEAWIATCGD